MECMQKHSHCFDRLLIADWLSTTNDHTKPHLTHSPTDSFVPNNCGHQLARPCCTVCEVHTAPQRHSTLTPSQHTASTVTAVWDSTPTAFALLGYICRARFAVTTPHCAVVPEASTGAFRASCP